MGELDELLRERGEVTVAEGAGALPTPIEGEIGVADGMSDAELRAALQTCLAEARWRRSERRQSRMYVWYCQVDL